MWDWENEGCVLKIDSEEKEKERSEEQRGVDVSPSSSWLLTVAMWNSDWLRVLWEGSPSHLQQGEIQQQGLWPHFCTGSSLCLYFSLQERGGDKLFYFSSFISFIIGICRNMVQICRAGCDFTAVKQINWISSVRCVTDQWMCLTRTWLYSEDRMFAFFLPGYILFNMIH